MTAFARQNDMLLMMRMMWNCIKLKKKKWNVPRILSLLGIIGAISMCLPDLKKEKHNMSEDEIDEFVYSVRKERYAAKCSDRSKSIESLDVILSKRKGDNNDS